MCLNLYPQLRQLAYLGIGETGFAEARIAFSLYSAPACGPP